MGLFKDVRAIKKMADDQVQAGGGRMKMMKDGLATAREAMGSVAEYQQVAQRLAANGVPAQATIKSMTHTGVTMNMMPELAFELTVNVNGQTAEVSHKQLVSPAMLGGLQPGATVGCSVDPADHSTLLLGMPGT